MMLSFYRLAEVAIYSLLNFLPFLALALYPFRHSLRFSIKTTFFDCSCDNFAAFLGAWAAFAPGNNTGTISAVSTILYAAFYFLAIKNTLAKRFYTFNDFKSCEPRCNFIKDHRKSFSSLTSPYKVTAGLFLSCLLW